MPWWLRTLTSLPKDLGSIPNTHVADHSHLKHQFQGILYPLQASEATRLTHKAYIHKVKKILKNNILMYKIPKTYKLHIDWHFLSPQNRHPASRRCRRPLCKSFIKFLFPVHFQLIQQRQRFSKAQRNTQCTGNISFWPLEATVS